MIKMTAYDLISVCKCEQDGDQIFSMALKRLFVNAGKL